MARRWYRNNEVPDSRYYIVARRVSHHELEMTIAYYDGEGWSTYPGGDEIEVEAATDLPEWPDWLVAGKKTSRHLYLLNG